MNVYCLPFILIALASTSAVAASYPTAEPAQTIVATGRPDCLVVTDAPAGRTVNWSGPCVDGYANGEGVLQWYKKGEPALRYEGGVRRGMNHGLGYLKWPDNSQLEATFVNDEMQGFGIMVYTNGDRYDGNFKNSKREGHGKMTYSLGGTYEGQFRNGLFHGKGTITYAGGRRATFEFVDGAWPEKPVFPDVERKYTLRVQGSDFAGRFDASKIPLIVPPDAGWAQLSPTHRKYATALYTLMDPRDEPPYPEQGIGALLREVLEIEGRGAGSLTMNAKVGADGRAQSVTFYASPSKRITSLVTDILMKAKYTPAKRGGVPCPMMFPFNLGLIESDSRFD